MNKFIVKKFVKNYENTADAAVREKYGKLAGAFGIALNLLLCAVKILAGIVFSSIAILADGINNLSDASASVITVIGFKLSGKKPDKDHPYGYGRTEYLTSLIISAMVLAIGVMLFKSSIEKMIHPQPAEFELISVIILLVAIALKLWLASFNMFMGRQISSAALLASGTDARNDVISTSVVLISMIAGKLFDVDLDGIAGLLVAIFIIWSGIGLVKESVSPILGCVPDPELVEAIKAQLLSHKEVLGVHDLVVHDYGPGRMFASVHAEVDSVGDMVELHDMIDNIEKEVYSNLSILLTVHMDPLNTRDPLVRTLAGQLESIISEMDFIKGFHDLRVVTGSSHTNVIFDIVLDHASKLDPHDVRALLDQKLKELNPRYETVITVDREFE